MNDTLALSVALLPIMLIAFFGLPNAWINAHIRLIRQLATMVVGLQFIMAATMLIALVTGQVSAIHSVLASFSATLPFEFTIHFDGIAGLMLTLISFVGFVVCRYSIRYLDGEESQGRYFRWTAMTIGAVSLMVISGNLLMFVAAWVMTSLGLHQLLLHYGHRPAAKRAAWAKFTISRFGDAALCAAIIILYSEFETLDFAELFARAGSLATVTPAIERCWLPVGDRSDHEVSSVPLSHLVAADDGDTDASVGTDARWDRQCWWLPDHSNESAGFADALGIDGTCDCRWRDCLFCRGSDADTDKHQEVARLFNDRSNGIHDAAVRAGSIFGGDAAYLGSFAVQSSRVLKQRECDQRVGRLRR